MEIAGNGTARLSDQGQMQIETTNINLEWAILARNHGEFQVFEDFPEIASHYEQLTIDFSLPHSTFLQGYDTEFYLRESRVADIRVGIRMNPDN